MTSAFTLRTFWALNLWGGCAFAFNEAPPLGQSVGGKVASLSTPVHYNRSGPSAGTSQQMFKNVAAAASCVRRFNP